MLELAILGTLKEQPLHGYELKKRLVDALGPFSSVSFGSLYPALARLQRAGAVEASEGPPPAEAAPPAPPAPIPMTGSIAGEAAAFRDRRARAARQGGGHGPRPEARSSRVRKVYRITPAGEALFAELLAADTATADDEKAFSLKFAFCRYLPPEARLGLLERRRAQLVERLARYRSSGRSRSERIDTYMRSLVDHDTEATERDITWLDSLIATEKQATPSPKEGS